MRRKDREITEPAKIREIIEASHCCRLGFFDGKEVYIVPLSFGYEEEEGRRFFYFHSAREGRKIDLISAAPSVGFELDTNYELVEGDLACNHSARFQSVIGTGRVSFVDAAEERKAALQSIMRHNTGPARSIRRSFCQAGRSCCTAAFCLLPSAADKSTMRFFYLDLVFMQSQLVNSVCNRHIPNTLCWCVNRSNTRK